MKLTAFVLHSLRNKRETHMMGPQDQDDEEKDEEEEEDEEDQKTIQVMYKDKRLPHNNA